VLGSRAGPGRLRRAVSARAGGRHGAHTASQRGDATAGQRLHLPGRQLPPAVRGPPRTPCRRHPGGADRGKGQRQPEEHQFHRQVRHLSAGITALPGVKPAAFARAGADANSANTFAGKGATESSNDFSGTITVIVRGVLPNGHLLIAGEKQIGVNTNVDVLRFSGQVDPRAIQTGNTVQSAQIANVRLEHRGRGAQAEAQAIGWLSRVFLSVFPI
jgi:hypothetical protein